MCSPVAVWLVFGFELPEMVEHGLEMGWWWERRPVHHRLGLESSVAEKLLSSTWFWFLKYSVLGGFFKSFLA